MKKVDASLAYALCKCKKYSEADSVGKQSQMGLESEG